MNPARRGGVGGGRRMLVGAAVVIAGYAGIRMLRSPSPPGSSSTETAPAKPPTVGDGVVPARSPDPPPAGTGSGAAPSPRTGSPITPTPSAERLPGTPTPAAIPLGGGAPPASPPSPAPPAEPESPEEAARRVATREAIKAAIQAVKPAVQKCYEQAIAENPDVGGGKIVAEFEIVGSPDGGHIESAEISESFHKNPLYDQCVMNALAATHFPAPLGTRMKVRYPFKFEH